MAGFEDEAPLQVTQPDAAYSSNIPMKVCHELLSTIAQAQP